MPHVLNVSLHFLPAGLGSAYLVLVPNNEETALCDLRLAGFP